MLLVVKAAAVARADMKGAGTDLPPARGPDCLTALVAFSGYGPAGFERHMLGDDLSVDQGRCKVDQLDFTRGSDDSW